MLSSVLITNNNGAVYVQESKPSVVAVFSAPPEHVSQASSRDLHTIFQRESSWDRHVEDVTKWAQDSRPSSYLLPSIWDGSKPDASQIVDYWNRVSRFHSLADLNDRGTAEDVDIANKSIDALTDHITDFYAHNEVKLINGTWSGILIQRHGLPVYFEDMSDEAMKELFGPTHPDWVTNEYGHDSLKVPEVVWKEAQRRHLPIMFFDGNPS